MGIVYNNVSTLQLLFSKTYSPLSFLLYDRILKFNYFHSDWVGLGTVEESGTTKALRRGDASDAHRV